MMARLKDLVHMWWFWVFVLGVILSTVIVVLSVMGIFGQGKTAAQILGPNAPRGQMVVIAQRNDNGQYQVLLSTYTGAGTSESSTNWDQPYYIMFNPTTSSDPSLTDFATYDEAHAYYKTAYVASPMNKSYSPLSTTALNADYLSIRAP